MHHRHLALRVLPVLALIATFFTNLNAEAARITKVKGNQVLIDVETSDIQEGQKYFVVVDGKKKAVVLVTKVKNGKALGNVTKGRAVVDAGVEPVHKTADGSGAPSSQSADSGSGSGEGGNSDDMVLKKKDKEGKSESSYYVGFLVGYAMDSQSLPDPNNNNVSMSGSGYGLKGFVDIPFSSRFGLIGRLGIEQFSLTGSSADGSFNTSIMYAATDALLRFNFTSGKFVPYLAGGLGIYFPVSKSSNILNVPQISSTTIFFGDLGFNYNYSKSGYFTMLAEYGYFPPSNNISTNFITVRAGMGFRF